jgi:pimeloyl-ACP methyl ester carboxylesterase
MRKVLRTKKLLILYVLIILMISGILWQSIMIRYENKNNEPVGKIVDVGTYNAHYYTKGDGPTAFIFITGSGTPSAYTDFYYLQNELSSKGQTITFDHAGSGWSTDTESERSIENLTKELSTIIEAVAPDKSIVLLCHSLSSLEAISYAQEYPEKVKGIVFLDAGSPEYYSNDSELTAKLINRSMAMARTIGLSRMFGECGLLLPMYGENIRNRQLPDELKKLDKAMYYRYAGNPSTLNVIKLINENASKVLDGASLGDIPILVLSSDSGQRWNDVQRKLAAWSTNSTQVTIQGTEHYIYWSNYKEVVKYINEFIEKISDD